MYKVGGWKRPVSGDVFSFVMEIILPLEQGAGH